jgi:hypothetical protein
MNKTERDQILGPMTSDERMDFGRFIRESVAEAKQSGGAKSYREVLESRRSERSEELQRRMDAVLRSDQMGPDAGETPPDFYLKRLATEDRVRLSSFWGKRPVALAFSSYT